MDLYEYQAKELFAAHGVPAPAGIVAPGHVIYPPAVGPTRTGRQG